MCFKFYVTNGLSNKIHLWNFQIKFFTEIRWNYLRNALNFHRIFYKNSAHFIYNFSPVQWFSAPVTENFTNYFGLILKNRFENKFVIQMSRFFFEKSADCTTFFTKFWWIHEFFIHNLLKYSLTRDKHLNNRVYDDMHKLVSVWLNY